jgi:hypothetical protein
MSSHLVYYDTTFSGLVPCKLVAVDLDRDSFRLEVTAERRGYSRGDRIETNARYCVPRDVVYRPRGCFTQRIRPYSWRERLA